MSEIKKIIENEYKNLKKDLEINFNQKIENILQEMEILVQFTVERKMRDATEKILKQLGHRKVKAIVYPQDETNLPDPPVYKKQTRSTSI